MKKLFRIEMPALPADIHSHMQKALVKLALVELSLVELSPVEPSPVGLKPAQKLTQEEAHKEIQSPYAFASAIDDAAAVKHIRNTVEEKKMLNPAMLIVIGIGGSNLGTLAVQQALLGSLYNDADPALKIYYADTVDTDYMHGILTLAETALKNGRTILLNLISKSGKTTESIANFELLLALLKKYRPDGYTQSIIITTDKDSPLWKLATIFNWTALEIPAHIGGRYSVFTAVGLFPLGMLNIDTDALLQGARDMRDQCLQTNDNPAAQTAARHYAWLHKGYNTANLFLFSNELHGCGSWWRQLVGESLGKAETLAGKPNTTALVPMVSVGTTDLHSVGQLYFANIAHIITQFVVIEHNRHEHQLPDYKEFETLVPHIQTKSLAHIMHAIASGVQKAYAHKNLPFCTVILPENNAYYIGQFLIYKMFETVFLAHLLNVNAFDQPEVEVYKKEVRAILARE